MQCIAAYLQRALAWVSGETSYLGLFSADVHSILGCMQQKTDQVYVEDPNGEMQAAPNRPQKANG